MVENRLWVHENYECVALEGMAVEIPVGIVDWERMPGKRQKLVISVEMYRRRGALEARSIDQCLDYARVFNFIDTAFGPDRPHTEYIETVAEEVIACCLDDPSVEACRVKIDKPHVLNGRALPRLEVYRMRPNR